MARRAEGVTEKLLECAKEEFMEKGYENASLRKIAEKAGSSKGAIYIRYPDKLSLFSALVDNAADGLVDLIRGGHQAFLELSADQQRLQMYERSDAGMERTIDYIYDHFDEFKLLLTCAPKDFYSRFIHRIVTVDVNTTLNYMANSGSGKTASAGLTPNLAHILSHAFYTGIFEIIVHDMPRKEGEEYIHRLRKFFQAGWETILHN